MGRRESDAETAPKREDHSGGATIAGCDGGAPSANRVVNLNPLVAVEPESVRDRPEAGEMGAAERYKHGARNPGRRPFSREFGGALPPEAA